MSRRSSPERINAARRAATIRRLEMTGMSPERAESWVARWEGVANAEGRPHDREYWEAFDVWRDAEDATRPRRD